VTQLRLFLWLAEVGYDCANIASYSTTKLRHRINDDGVRRWRRGVRQIPLRVAVGLFDVVKPGHPERTLEDGLRQV
jgi:hypothetical protein